MLTDMAGISLSGVEGIGLGGGELEMKIIDEDSKININVANDPKMRKRLVQQLAMLMAPIEYDEMFDRAVDDGKFVEREDLICEILDWADPDEDLCDLSGSEDRSIYQSLDPSYERKNAPFDSLEELHLVSGLGDDFWAAFVDPNPEEPDARVMTVWGKGKVNVNTAPPQVLYPLVCMLATDSSGMSPCLDPYQQFNLLQILQTIKFIRTFMPFSKVRDFIAAIERPEERLFLPLPGFPMSNKRMAKHVMTTSSTVFSIYSTGSAGRVTRRIHTVVDIEGLDMLDPTQSLAASGGSILYWRME